MSSRWWFPFDGMEEMAFRRVPEGYIYRAPNPWLVGCGRYYLLNEQQKSDIAARIRRMWHYFGLAIVVVVAVGVPLTMRWVDQHPFAFLGATALVGLVIGFALNAYLARSVEPIVAGLTPTAQRITRHDALTNQVVVFSNRTIVFYGLLSLAMFALSAVRPLFGAAQWDPISIAGALLFGSGALYWLVLYVAKRRRSAA